jgi:hypothetical protein
MMSKSYSHDVARLFSAEISTRHYSVEYKKRSDLMAQKGAAREETVE